MCQQIEFSIFCIYQIVYVNISTFNFSTGELLNNRTLFGDLMHCLESVIQPDTKPISVLIDDSYNDSFNDSHQLLTFQQWESKHAKKYSVSHLLGFDLDFVFSITN